MKKKYVWLCAYYYLTEIIEYEFDESRLCLANAEIWQIEELAYKGLARKKHNKHWFDSLMRLANKKRR